MDRNREARAKDIETLRSNALALVAAMPEAGAAIAVGLCGSVARGDAGEGSDVDVFVVVEDGAPPSADVFWWDAVSRAMAPIGRPVSVIVYTPEAIRRVSSWYVLRLARDAVFARDTGGAVARLFRQVVDAARASGLEERVVDGRSTWMRSAATLGRAFRLELGADAWRRARDAGAP